MDKSQLFQILSREHEKLEKGGAAWLREYASSAQRDLGFTFYMISRVLAQSTQSRVRSTDVQEQITAYVEKNGVRFTRKWNPVDWFTSRWTSREGLGLGARQGPFSNNPETYFDPAYAEIINRDKQQVWRMWLAGPYADEVRRFFGQHVGEPTLHDEAQPMSEESPRTALGRRLFWNPPETMEEVARLLLDKRQLIFYGPPGIGKTYVARALAKHLIGEEKPDDFLRFLQFHPSYSYGLF